MNGSDPRLVLLAGDLREAVAGGAPARLEIDRGVVRRVGGDGATASWDVSGYRMCPTLDDVGSGATYAFVTASGEVRCWADLGEWMPGVLHGGSGELGNGLSSWQRHVAEAVADAAGVPRALEEVATTGIRIEPAERTTVRPGVAVLLAAAALGIGIGLFLGITRASEAGIAAAGLFGMVHVMGAAVPRALWPRRRATGEWRIPLAAPALARAGELVGTGQWLAHSTPGGVRRWIPLAGPTAPVRAVVAPHTGRVVLQFGGASLDLTPSSASDLPELARRLAEAGVPVQRVAAVEAPLEGPVEPSGLPGDAQLLPSLRLTALLGTLLAVVLVRTDPGVAAMPMAVAAGLALVLALVGLLSRRALRRAAR